MATVAFDVVGTLFSLGAARREMTSAGAPGHTVDLLMAQTLRDYFALSHSGQYTPLAEVLDDALPRALAAVDVDIEDETADKILGSFRRLKPADGARHACETFGQAGFDRLAVTNSSRQLARDLIDRADLNEHIDRVVSCDSIGVSKPHPNVYERLRESSDLPVWMVAAHGRDVAGAAHAGLPTAWISSSEEFYLDVFPEPNVVADDLAAAANRVVGTTATDEPIGGGRPRR